MKITAIIPARMASSRFPGKPLADILGLPMIEHVRRRVGLCPLFHEVVVATCDQEIFDVVVKNGGQAIMTADTYERCTDRIEEAALHLNTDIVVNVQGDEPFVRPEMFEPLLIPLLNDPQLECANLMNEIQTVEDFNSPAVVKTVCDIFGNAIYFSREPIPSIKKADKIPYKKYRQLGIIAFRKEFLHQFSKLPMTPLEIVESVDMMRAVEHGYKVRMVLSQFPSFGVDTPEDLARAIEIMKNDDLLETYR